MADPIMLDLDDMLHGRGRHAGHQQRQIGRCVRCSCGARAQGRLPGDPAARGVPVWEVVLPDGFVSYRGTDPTEAARRAALHEGASVRQQ